MIAIFHLKKIPWSDLTQAQESLLATGEALLPHDVLELASGFARLTIDYTAFEAIEKNTNHKDRE